MGQRQQIFIIRHQGGAGVLVIVHFSGYLRLSFGGSIFACNKASAGGTCADDNILDVLGHRLYPDTVIILGLLLFWAQAAVLGWSSELWHMQKGDWLLEHKVSAGHGYGL